MSFSPMTMERSLRRLFFDLAGASVLMMAATVAHAAPGPIGGEYSVGDRILPAKNWWMTCTDASGHRAEVATSADPDGEEPGDLFLKRFDPSGKQVGPSTKINESPAWQAGYRLVCSEAGWVLAQWSEQGCLRQRVFDPANARAGAAVGVPSRDCRVRASLAVGDGGAWVAAWPEALPSQGTRIFAQRFDAAGQPVGDRVQMSEGEAGWRLQPKVAVEQSGIALVVWLGQSSGWNEAQPVMARYLDTDAEPQGDAFQVNTFGYGVNNDPAIVRPGDGNFEVVWTNVLEGGRVARRVGEDASPGVATSALEPAAPLPRFGAVRLLDSVKTEEGLDLADDVVGAANTTSIVAAAGHHYRTIDGGIDWDGPVEVEEGFGREALTCDGAGTCLALIPGPDDSSLRVKRSIDNGASWGSAATLADLGGHANDVGALVARAGGGTWLAAWTMVHTGNLMVSRSRDAGLSWSKPKKIAADSFVGRRGFDLATNGKGTWIFAVADLDVNVLVSTDDGVNWSAPAMVAEDVYCANCAAVARHSRIQLANDGDAHWVAMFGTSTWKRDVYGADGDVFAVRSGDGGESWTEPSPLDGAATLDGGPDFAPSIAVDASGRWLAAWSSHRPVGPEDNLDADLLVSVSTDAGATWSEPSSLDPAMNTDASGDSGVLLAARGADTWLAVWQRRPFARNDYRIEDQLVMSVADATCGDAVIEAGEQCDDGNRENGDGCDANCMIPACGNAIVEEGESCDDGNDREGDDCTSNCKLPRCGDGIVSFDEACDDGNEIDTDECPNNCGNTAFCGDGHVRAGYEECDSGGRSTETCTPDCKLPRCGDGYVAPYREACDDGNTVDDDACPNDCSRFVCGDGFTSVGFEECDPEDDLYRNGCTDDCRLVGLCGDANADDVVTVTDALLILGKAVGLAKSCPKAACDMDGNGEITGIDALTDLRKAVGLEVGEHCSIGTGSIVFWIDETRPVGSFQLDIDYEETGGSFVGSGSDVHCTALVGPPELLAAFNDHDTTRVLTAGLIAVEGFGGRMDLFRCEFEMPEERAGVRFHIRVVDATSPDFESLVPLPLVGYRVE